VASNQLFSAGNKNRHEREGKRKELDNRGRELKTGWHKLDATAGSGPGNLEIENRSQHRATEPAVRPYTPGVKGIIKSPITQVDPGVFLHLISSGSFQNTIKIIITDDAKFANFGLHQEVKLLGEPKAGADTQKRSYHRQPKRMAR